MEELPVSRQLSRQSFSWFRMHLMQPPWSFPKTGRPWLKPLSNPTTLNMSQPDQAAVVRERHRSWLRTRASRSTYIADEYRPGSRLKGRFRQKKGHMSPWIRMRLTYLLVWLASCVTACGGYTTSGHQPGPSGGRSNATQFYAGGSAADSAIPSSAFGGQSSILWTGVGGAESNGSNTVGDAVGGRTGSRGTTEVMAPSTAGGGGAGAGGTSGLTGWGGAISGKYEYPAFMSSKCVSDSGYVIGDCAACQVTACANELASAYGPLWQSGATSGPCSDQYRCNQECGCKDMQCQFDCRDLAEDNAACAAELRRFIDCYQERCAEPCL